MTQNFKKARKALTAVNKGLQTAAEKSEPIIEKGFAGVYRTLATGFDMGVSGVKKGVSVIKSYRAKKMRSMKTRSSRVRTSRARSSRARSSRTRTSRARSSRRR